MVLFFEIAPIVGAVLACSVSAVTLSVAAEVCFVGVCIAVMIHLVRILVL